MIYLARHGQTEWNLARRYQGGSDSPLTELGRAQARRMGELLTRLVPDPAGWRMVASPLGRAHHTARIIAQTLGGVLEPELDARLAEVSMGSWDGLSLDELEARRPADLPYPERYFQAPGGERLEAVEARLADWLASVRETENIILVSHGLSGRILRGLYGGLPREAMLTLPTPQDAIHRLAAGQVAQIDCDPV